MNPSRREFFREIIGGAAGALFLSGASCGPRRSASEAAGTRPAEAKASRLVLVRDPEYAKSGKIDDSRLRKQLQKAIAELTGAEDQREAWRAFFDASDTVGLKVNCLGAPEIVSHPQLCAAVARELQGIGVDKDRVLVWDRTRGELEAGGFRDSEGFLLAATDDEGVGYEADITLAGEVGACFSRLLTSQCTAMVNVPLIKDHGIVGATCSLKNWLGTISNPNKLHHNQGDPMIADLNLAEEIRSKQKLIVCDAFDLLYHGGPSLKPEYLTRFGALLVGTDPVALDTYAVKLIESERAKAKLPTLAEEKREPTYIARAGDDDHRVGQADLSKVQIVELTL